MTDLVAVERQLYRHVRLILFSIPIIFFGLLVLYKRQYGIDDGIYLRLVREDSIVEWASFFALFAAFSVGAYVAREYLRAKKSLHGAYFALVSLFCLFVALEEISYAQRVFSISTPQAITEINSQNEINVHNIAATSHFAYVIAPRLVLAYCITGFLVFQIAVRPLPRLKAVKELVFPWYCISYFVPLAVYRAFEINGYPVDTCCDEGQFLIWQDQEPAEMFFAFGFLIFMCGALWNYRAEYRSTPSPR